MIKDEAGTAVRSPYRTCADEWGAMLIQVQGMLGDIMELWKSSVVPLLYLGRKHTALRGIAVNAEGGAELQKESFTPPSNEDDT